MSKLNSVRTIEPTTSQINSILKARNERNKFVSVNKQGLIAELVQKEYDKEQKRDK